MIAYHFREAATLTSATKIAQLDVVEIRRRAVSWLQRAADVAAAGAATAEAARHLRAAIELAAPDDLPELQERLGDVSGGDEGAEASRIALQLCRERGRPVDQELRVLGSLLARYTRFQGTVGKRPSEEEMQRLLANLQARCERMLALQMEVFEGTVRTEKAIFQNPDGQARPRLTAAFHPHVAEQPVDDP